MLVEVGFDGGFEFGHAVEHTAADGVSGDQAEEAFDQVDPGGRGGREMEVEAGMAFEPGLDLGVLVGGVIVDNQVQIERFGGVAVARMLGKKDTLALSKFPPIVF